MRTLTASCMRLWDRSARDVAESGLRAGDIGTEVERHVVVGVSEEGYSVEFFDMTGNGRRGHAPGERLSSAHTSRSSGRPSPQRVKRLPAEV